MGDEFIEKRRFKRDSAATRVLKKIMPLGSEDMTLVEVIEAESKALRDAQTLASTMYSTCSPLDLHLANHAPRLPYRDRMELVKPQVHAGQLKLFLSELRFLTEFASDPDKLAHLMYAGAAPGIHIPYLANLFPNVTFALYDPREFCDEIFKIRNVSVIHRDGHRGIKFGKYCVDPELRRMLDNTFDIRLFISDIRSGDVDDPKCDFEKSCQKDMEDQMYWIRTMKPRASMIKFRLPYSAGRTEYLAPVDDEHLWFGVFAPRGSTELRLVTGPDCRMQTYDNTKIEEQAYYFNNFTRIAQYAPSNKHPKKAALGMDNCWDCCAMREICYGYLSQKYEAGADAPLPEKIAHIIILTEILLPTIANIVVDYACPVTEDDLYDFIAAVVRECKAGDKLHAAPHGCNLKCVPWVDVVGPAGFALEPHDPKAQLNHVGSEVRKLYMNAMSAAGKK